MAKVTRRHETGAAPWWRGFAVGLASGVLLAVALYFTVGPGSEPGAPSATVVAQATGAAGAAAARPAPKFEFFTVLPDQEVPVPEEQVGRPGARASAPAPLANGAPAIRVLSGQALPPTATATVPEVSAPAAPAAAPEAAPPAPAALAGIEPVPAPQETPTATTPPPAARAGQYMLQAGSFRGAADAERVKARLALSGVRADVQPVTVNGATWYRVRVGPFATLEELGATRAQLQASGLPSLVLRLRAGT